jgi:hypothetical protein
MAKSVRSQKQKKPEDSPRSKRARAVGDMLPDVGRAAFRRFGFIQSSVVTRWREIVGERYAGVSAPESIRFPHGSKSEGVLTLVVEGAHAPMMQHVAPVIIERVNRFFGYQAVERVAFKQGLVRVAQGRKAPPSLRPLHPDPSEPAAEIPADLGESIRQVSDPELRACLESLARGLAAGDAAPPATLAIPVVGRIGERKS